MVGLLPPTVKEVQLGRAEVRRTFTVPKVGMIGGSYVLDGLIRRGAQCRLVRDGVQIYEGRIGSLKRFKDDAREVQTGFECGIGIDGYNDLKVGDVIEAYAREEHAATLA
jgi:translation initiation factor IF-2